MLSLFIEKETEFLLVGAYAMGVHGVPRATGDMDLLVKPSKENARRVYDALAEFGAPLANVSVEDFESPETVFQVGVAPCRIDVLTKIDGLTFDEASEDRVMAEVGGLTVPVISKAKLIVNKLATGRSQDQVDAENLKGL
jgi:hypothetical protein